MRLCLHGRSTAANVRRPIRLAWSLSARALGPLPRLCWRSKAAEGSLSPCQIRIEGFILAFLLVDQPSPLLVIILELPARRSALIRVGKPHERLTDYFNDALQFVHMDSSQAGHFAMPLQMQEKTTRTKLEVNLPLSGLTVIAAVVRIPSIHLVWPERVPMHPICG